MAFQSQRDSRSLYHRWRSRSFSEVVAQEHVIRTLRNAVAAGRIVHAYLFCGPRGTGKTSTARVLAKAANCLDPQGGEPCNRCPSCVAVNEGRAIDLIEIDAASNRGIDDARELREKIRYSPAESRYKVYIIDEAHMLTSEASNALLKTLEEPPEHAILILATTEAHKILPTISSRCQRFDFRRIPLRAIVEQLAMICEREGLEVEVGVLDRVAKMAMGSLRDAESLLDQLVAYCGESIDLASTREVLGLTGEEAVPELAEALRAGDLARGFSLIDGAASTGADLRHLCRELVDYLRALMVARSGADTSLVREYRPEEWAQLKSSSEGWSHQQLLSALRALGELEGRMRLEPFNQLHLETAFMEVALAAPQPRSSGIVVEDRTTAAGAEASPGSPSAKDGGGDGSRQAERDRGVSGTALTLTFSQGEREKEVSLAHREREEDVTPSQEGRREDVTPSQRERGGEVSLSREEGGVPKLDLAGVRAQWPRVLEELGTSGMALRACQPLRVVASEITFAVEKAGLKSTIERPVLRRQLQESLGKVFGIGVTVQFQYGVRVSREVAAPERDAVVNAAVQEFGFKVLPVQGESGVPGGPGDPASP